jgi:hypothetical protein
MSNSLKHVFSKQVVLEDGSVFYYSILPYQLMNALGNSIAVLQEYNFAKKGDEVRQFSCRLHRTKDGNWYDLEEPKSSDEKKKIRMLKLAIDATGNAFILK